MPAAWVAGAGAIIGAGASIYSANKQSSAAQKAAQTQADAGKYATDAQTSMFNKINDQQAPWRDAGGKAINSLSDLTSSGYFNNPIDPTFSFGAKDLNENLAPNYQFMLDQGIGAVNNQASVSGGLISGNAIKGVNDYAQKYAQNGYQQAYDNAFKNHQTSFDNMNTTQSNIFNRLASIAGVGQIANGQTAAAGTAAANSIGNIATNTAQNIGSAQLYGGAAQASGINGAANSISNGLNNWQGWYMAQPHSDGSSISNGDIARANASNDPIASLNSSQGWTN